MGSEYDEALHGSDEESDGSDVSDNEVLGKSKKTAKKVGKTYIVEDDDEPLDLLDRKALANISSTKPLKQRTVVRTKAKMDLDGKLLLGGDSDDDEDDAMILDTPGAHADEDEGGVGAYVKALKGRDAVQRGRGGRGGIANGRRGLGEDKRSGSGGGHRGGGGRVMKSPRGRGGRR